MSRAGAKAIMTLCLCNYISFWKVWDSSGTELTQQWWMGSKEQISSLDWITWSCPAQHWTPLGVFKQGEGSRTLPWAAAQEQLCLKTLSRCGALPFSQLWIPVTTTLCSQGLVVPWDTDGAWQLCLPWWKLGHCTLQVLLGTGTSQDLQPWTHLWWGIEFLWRRWCHS